MIVNSTEFQNNFGKYLMLVAKEDIIITKNGREVARLTTVEPQQRRAEYMDAAIREEVAEYLFNNRKASYEEFLKLYKDSQYRFEYIDGEIYLLASPRITHQITMKNLFFILCNWFEGKKCTPLAAPYDIRLWRNTHKTEPEYKPDGESNSRNHSDENQAVELRNHSVIKPNIVQPDLMVICDLEEKLDEDGYYTGVPALVIEIVSESTRSRDYVKKLDLYMSCGVQEYWIVNPLNKSITIFHFKDYDICDNATYKESETAKSYIFEGLTVEVDKVFM